MKESVSPTKRGASLLEVSEMDDLNIESINNNNIEDNPRYRQLESNLRERETEVEKL